MLPKNTDYVLCEVLPSEDLLVVAVGKKKKTYNDKTKLESKNPGKEFQVHPYNKVAGSIKVGQILTPISVIINRSMAKKEKFAADFQRIFNICLDGYWDTLCGFNILKFDSFVKPANGVSRKEAVEKRWGQAAVKLLLELMTPTTTV